MDKPNESKRPNEAAQVSVEKRKVASDTLLRLPGVKETTEAREFLAQRLETQPAFLRIADLAKSGDTETTLVAIHLFGKEDFSTTDDEGNLIEEEVVDEVLFDHPLLEIETAKMISEKLAGSPDLHRKVISLVYGDE